MTTEELRITFEAHFKLPFGVHWEGDHYTGSQDTAGSYRNASEWNSMFRGFRAAAKEFGHAD